MYNKNVNSCEGIYNNSLDVRFGKACDNDCDFCIEKSGVDSLGQVDVKNLVVSTLLSKKQEILILGGEPFLNIDKLHDYIVAIRPFKEKIYITTSLPKTIDLFNDKVIKILDLIDGLNCSLHHYDYRINNKVLNASSNHDRVFLLNTISDSYSNKIRVQTNLVKGILDTKEELRKFLELMQIIGIKNVKVNELQNAPSQYISYENIVGIKMKEPYAYGCQNKVKLNDFEFTLKRSCFLTENSLNSTRESLEKLNKHEQHHTSVLYENGDISKGWKQKEKERESRYQEDTISCHSSAISVGGCH